MLGRRFDEKIGKSVPARPGTGSSGWEAREGRIVEKTWELLFFSSWGSAGESRQGWGRIGRSHQLEERKVKSVGNP